jgi:HK97 family phage portal protein
MRNPLRSLFETRAIGSSYELAQHLMRGYPSTAGVEVTETTAMRVAAVATCVSLISRTVASLPIDVIEQSGETRRVVSGHWLSQALLRPNGWQTRFEFLQVMQALLSLHRNAYAWLNWVGRGSTRRVAEMIPLHPSQMRVFQKTEFDAPVYVLRRGNGEDMPLAADEVLHLRAMSTNGVQGRSALDDGRDLVGGALAQQDHSAGFWGSGGNPDVVLKHPKTLSDKAKKGLEDSWQDTYGGGQGKKRVAVIEEGMEVTPLTWSNEAAQFLETRQMSRAEIAGYFHVPPYMIGDIEKQTSWGSGVEQQQIGFVNFTIRPDLVLWEDKLCRQCLENDPRYSVKFRVEGLLRGDSAARAAFYKTMREIGAYSANDVRAYEDLNPRPGGDLYGDLAYASGKTPSKESQS